MGQLESWNLRLHPVFHHVGEKDCSDLMVARCSGIHRGMGTHISRVKSVDLDSWTDEQLQSVLNWGNARANKSVTGSDHGSLVSNGETGTGKRSWHQAMSRLNRRSK